MSNPETPHPEEVMRERKERAEEAKRERINTYTNEFPRDDKCYIVVKGRPDVWYGSQLADAEEVAVRKAEEEQCEYTIMSVPIASVDMALVAKYHGVVIHALDRLEADDE